MSDVHDVPASQDSVDLEAQPTTVIESQLLLLKSKNDCDVTFTFPNLPNRIEAHEFCLKNRSPVFARMFRKRKSGDAQGHMIEISESTPEIFQQFLEFVYADKFELDISGALELLQVSQKYEVHPLTKKCEELLQTEIPIVDSIKVFRSARRYGHPDLADRAGEIMAKSFWMLMKDDALANAEEETLVYLLDNDDLRVLEVELFEFILDWGRKKAGTSDDEELLKDKLKNLIPKIRYTNMTPYQFTKVVVPTGLLTADETILIYSYLCGDGDTRRESKIKFNTTQRRILGDGRKVTVTGDLYTGQHRNVAYFPAFSKQCISFKAEKIPVARTEWVDYILKKAVITEIILRWPILNPDYQKNISLNFHISIREYSGPVKDGKFTIRFEKNLLNCNPGTWDRVSVELPVELMSGRTYSIIVENNTAMDHPRFEYDDLAYYGDWFDSINQEAEYDLDGVRMILKEIHSNTDYYRNPSYCRYEDIVVIREVTIGMV